MKFVSRFLIIFISLQFILNCSDLKSNLSKKDLVPIDLTTIGYNPQSSDEGIFPDISVLKNPNNPFIKTGIIESNKWDIANASLSDGATYYLWATILAISPSGENQYYTAEAIRTLEANSSRAQRAYEMVLENFFYDLTYPGGGAPPQYIASWACSALNTNFYADDIMCP